jgi:hypothetical protein
MLGVVALIALAAAGPTAPPRAAEAPPQAEAPPPEVRPSDQVKITVLAILATDQNEKIDKCASCIAREVQKDNGKLTGFKVHQMMCQSIPVGGAMTFKLIDDQSVGVTVDRGAFPDDRVVMRIEPPGLGTITYETCCNKFLPVVTRYRTADNQVLIIAVRVQPCKCSK